MRLLQIRGVTAQDSYGNIVHGDQVIENFLGMNGTYLVTRTEYGTNAVKIKPETVR